MPACRNLFIHCSLDTAEQVTKKRMRGFSKSEIHSVIIKEKTPFGPENCRECYAIALHGFAG